VGGPWTCSWTVLWPLFRPRAAILRLASVTSSGSTFNNPNVTRVSNTNLKVAPGWTVAFHELAEAYEKIDGGKGGSYAVGRNAALQREMELRDQRPYLKEYNTGAGGPANSPNPQGGIIIKR
jgi:hypothetical protein